MIAKTGLILTLLAAAASAAPPAPPPQPSPPPPAPSPPRSEPPPAPAPAAKPSPPPAPEAPREVMPPPVIDPIERPGAPGPLAEQRLRAHLLEQLERARPGLARCAARLPPQAARPPAIEVQLEQRGKRQSVTLGDARAIRPLVAQRRFTACARRAVLTAARPYQGVRESSADAALTLELPPRGAVM